MNNWKEQLNNKELELSNSKKREGGEDMISAEGALKDYEAIVNNKELNDSAKLVAVMRIMIKLLLTMRSNQILPEAEKVRIYEASKKNKEKRDSKK